jgi:hypothetical protein
MKKLLMLFVALATSGIMYGQLHFGPQIGFSSSNLSLNTDSITNNLKNNFMFGVFVRMGNKFYVQPEVNWVTQGSVFRYPSVSLNGVNLSPVEQNIKLSTIQIPVNAGYRIINIGVANIRVHGGVTASIVTDKTINNTDDDNSIGQDLLDPITEEDISDLQWQYQIGAGVDVLMFALDVSYYGGINDLVNGNVSYNNTTHSISSKSNVFMVTLGWKIF